MQLGIRLLRCQIRQLQRRTRQPHQRIQPLQRGIRQLQQENLRLQQESLRLPRGSRRRVSRPRPGAKQRSLEADARMGEEFDERVKGWVTSELQGREVSLTTSGKP